MCPLLLLLLLPLRLEDALVLIPRRSACPARLCRAYGKKPDPTYKKFAQDAQQHVAKVSSQSQGGGRGGAHVHAHAIHACMPCGTALLPSGIALLRMPHTLHCLMRSLSTQRAELLIAACDTD